MNFEQPNAVQKSFLEWVALDGCIVSRSRHGVQIHHIFGRTAKKKGVGNIGHYAILPLHWANHSYIDQGLKGLNLLKREFVQSWGDEYEDVIEEMGLHEFEKFLFEHLLTNRPILSAIPDDVRQAIQEYHR